MPSEESDQIFRGKNVEAAIAAGLAALGLRRDQVEVEVLHPGSRGLLGIGAEDARVRLTVVRPSPPPKPSRHATARAAQAVPTAEASSSASGAAAASPRAAAPEAPPPAPAPVSEVMPSAPTPIAAPQPAPAPGEPSDADQQLMKEAAELLQGLLACMDIRAKVRAYRKERTDEGEEEALVLNVEGDDLGILIGRRGETLAALQYLVRLMVNHRFHRWVNIVVDIEEYKERRAQQLRQLAQRMAQRVMQTGKPVALEAMPARERRIVHMTLRDHPAVTTVSVGEGEQRKVTIRPR